jgi:recombination protein RecT
MSSTALAVVEQSQVARELGGLTKQLLSLLPGPEAVRRFQRVTVQALVKNPDLLDCTPDSVVQSVMEAAAMGLEPTGSTGGAYLVPRNVNVGTKDRPKYEKQAQLIPDYRGVSKMVTRTRMDGSPSDVAKVEWRVVKEGDEFAWTEGTAPTLTHVPALAPDRSAKPTTHVYAVGTLRSGETLFDVMDHAAVERIRKRGKPKAFSPWDSDWDEMAKARVVKRLCKMLPVEPVVLAIINREDEQAGESADAPDVPVEVTGSRTRQLAAKLRQEPVQDAPSAQPEPEAAPVAPEPVEEAVAVALCPARSDEKLGAVEDCSLPAGHESRPGPKRHQSAAGTVWPVAKAAAS